MKRLMSSAAALSLLAGSAWADVTAQEVWDVTRSELLLSGSGDVTIGAEVPIPDGLRIESVALLTEEDGVSVSVVIDQITFRELGDGSVSVSWPETIPLTISSVQDGQAFEGAGSINQLGAETIVSGFKDALKVTSTQDEVSISFDNLVLPDGEDIVNLNLVLALKDIETNYTADRPIGSNMVSYDYGTTAAEFDMDFAFSVPGQDEGAEMDFDGAGFDLSLKISYPEGIEEFEQAMATGDGIDMAMDYALASMTGNIDITDEDGKGNIAMTFGETVSNFIFNRDTIGTGFVSKAVDMNVVVPTFPLPLNFKLTELGMDFAMPTGSVEEAQPFNIGIILRDLAVDEIVWNILDPGQVFERGPFTAVLDLAGMGQFAANILDPEQAAALDDMEVPGTIDSLTLEELNVTGVGASLTGNGAFTFDNTDYETIPDFPRPEGSVFLKLVGGNALLDKLVEMGLIGMDEAMGARMMMGLFANQGEGEDELTSTLEVNEQGHVLANGQRLR